MTATILVGDVRWQLATLPDASVQCCVTSPPYYGLRDYNVSGQIGLEPTLAEYLATMVDVFREVRRVLRPDGTCWVNMGDSYSGAGYGNHDVNGPEWKAKAGLDRRRDRQQTRKIADAQIGLKPKDLMMVPARLAIALCDDGWWLRSDIIWAKPNPMPESVRDRPTSAHEHIFLLTKSSKYFCNMDAVRQPLTESSVDRLSQDVAAQEGSVRANGGAKTNGAMKAVVRIDKQRGHSRRHDGFNGHWNSMTKDEQQAQGANLRNVWSVATRPFSEAHFAVFPPEIPRRCILMGSREGDTILDPFLGSGTTLLVADQLGRHGIGIELNPEYAEMARRRIYNDAPLLASVAG